MTRRWPAARERARPRGAVLAPAHGQVDQGGGAEGRGDAPGEAQRDGDERDQQVAAADQQEQGTRDERHGERLGVGLEHHGRRRVEAPQAGGDQGEALALRLPVGVHARAEDRPDEHGRRPGEHEVQHAAGPTANGIPVSMTPFTR